MSSDWKFVSVSELPLTANGKVDRRALPAPVPDSRDTGEALASPRTKLERCIAGIWQDLLGVKKVGLHDNFFEMGGHSLLLVQLHYRLQAELSRVVPITALFQYPTIAALTKHFGNEPLPSPGKAQQRHLVSLTQTAHQTLQSSLCAELRRAGKVRSGK